MRSQAKGQEQEHSMRWTGYMVIVDAHANEVLQTLARARKISARSEGVTARRHARRFARNEPLMIFN